MEKDAGRDWFAPHEARGHFDATLAHHMERLVGTSKGIGELPLNLATISCLGLLVECETEIKALPSSPLRRYTRQTFHNDLFWGRVTYNHRKSLPEMLVYVIFLLESQADTPPKAFS